MSSSGTISTDTSIVALLLELLRREIEEHPLRSLLDAVLLGGFIYILLQKSYRVSKKPDRLTEKEVDELVDEWTPEPLAPPEGSDLDGSNKGKDKKLFSTKRREHKVVLSASKSEILVEGVNQPVVNFAAYNFLGLAADADTVEECKKTIDKYGVGACGPRGFYGTIDVHLEAEKKICEFMGTEDCIVYSYGFCTISSVIPAFAKRGDLLVCDERIGFPIQEGIDLSRSKVHLFKHNDMNDLERILRQIQEHDVKSGKSSSAQRRFIVVQGVYESSGDIAPLKRLVEMKNKYKYRLIVDDSFGIGVLGATGRGTAEHSGVDIRDIDIFTASLENAFGTAGGFCVGSTQVIDYQRLSGLGYCFSASLPPYLCVASAKAVEKLQNNPQILHRLNTNIQLLHNTLESSFKQQRSLTEHMVLKSSGIGPILHLRLSERLTCDLSRDQQEALLEEIADRALSRGVAITVPRFSEREFVMPAPSIRICITADHNKRQIHDGANVLIDTAAEVIKEYINRGALVGTKAQQQPQSTRLDAVQRQSALQFRPGHAKSTPIANATPVTRTMH